MNLDKFPSRYHEDIEKAYFLLKNEGCETIFIFGSLVTGNTHENSDIDIGIKGLPPAKFFRVYSKLYMSIQTEVHLTDFDTDNDLYSLLDRLGEVIEIG